MLEAQREETDQGRGTITQRYSQEVMLALLEGCVDAVPSS